MTTTRTLGAIFVLSSYSTAKEEPTKENDEAAVDKTGVIKSATREKWRLIHHIQEWRCDKFHNSLTHQSESSAGLLMVRGHFSIL